MNRYKILFIISLLILTGFGILYIDKPISINEEITPTPLQESFGYKVTKVVDGDTVKLNIDGNEETIRLIGIDTPETVHPSRPVECFGIEASNYAKEKLSDQYVELEKDPSQGEVDRYGRTLGYIILPNGDNFNEQIIKDGYAYEYTYRDSYKYQKEFMQAEEYARDNKLGLWADGACK